MLDREGNPVASQLNYAGACYRQPVGNANAAARVCMHTGPMRRDLYRLRDRKTMLPVASNAQLERGYLAAKGEAKTGAADGRRAFCGLPRTGHGR